MSTDKEHRSEIDRSYPEEWHLENGNYRNVCKKCSNEFFGLNHRTICKVCNIPAPVEPQSVVLSAEKYFSESGLYAEGKLKTDIIKLLEGFADLRVQQER